MAPAVKSGRPKKKVLQDDKQAVKPLTSQEPQIQWPSIDIEAWQTVDLQLLHVVPGQIVTISNFWSATLCKKYVSFLKTLPLTTTPGTPRRGDAVRVNDRFQINDAAFANKLWNSGLKQMLLFMNKDQNLDTEEHLRNLWGGEVLGLSPNIRIYRYSKGQFFDKHYDDSNTLTHPGPPPTTASTTWTLLLYLTSPATGCIGGETVFYPEPATKRGKNSAQESLPVVVGLETGMALLHKHGRECMLHEGREVVEGEKWVIRSDLCVKR